MRILMGQLDITARNDIILDNIWRLCKKWDDADVILLPELIIFNKNKDYTDVHALLQERATVHDTIIIAGIPEVCAGKTYNSIWHFDKYGNRLIYRTMNVDKGPPFFNSYEELEYDTVDLGESITAQFTTSMELRHMTWTSTRAKLFICLASSIPLEVEKRKELLSKFSKEQSVMSIFINKKGTDDNAYYTGGSFVIDKNGNEILDLEDRDPVIYTLSNNDL